MDSEKSELYKLLWPSLVFLGVIIGTFVRLLLAGRYRKNKEAEQDALVRKADEYRMANAALLHDEVQPCLHVANLKLQMLQLQPERATLLAEEVMEDITKALRHIRDISNMTMPYGVTGHSLVEAIHHLMEKLDGGQLELELNHNELPLFQPGFLRSLCPVLQEIIYNTIKHSAATMLRIDAFYGDNLLTIKTAEHGWQSSKPSQKSAQPGIGRSLMESRIRLLKGTMDHQFHKQHGIAYVLRIPVATDQLKNYE